MSTASTLLVPTQELLSSVLMLITTKLWGCPQKLSREEKSWCPAFWHTRAFHQQYTIKALGKELTAFRDLCRALVHLLSYDKTLKILIPNKTLKFLITCTVPGLMNLNVVEVQISSSSDYQF
jgi:hypothetical protein